MPTTLIDNYAEFPQNCPPGDAIERACDIFIFVKNNPVQPDDLRTQYQKNRMHHGCPCERRALSCGVSQEYLDSMKEIFPSSKGWKWAVGKLAIGDGKIKPTGANKLHFSLWVNKGIAADFNKKFEVL